MKFERAVGEKFLKMVTDKSEILATTFVKAKQGSENKFRIFIEK